MVLVYFLFKEWIQEETFLSNCCNNNSYNNNVHTDSVKDLTLQLLMTRLRRSASPLGRDAAPAAEHACVCRPLRRTRSAKPRRGRDDSNSNQISSYLVLLKARPRVVIYEMDAETAESGEDERTCLPLDLADPGSYVFYSYTV